MSVHKEYGLRITMPRKGTFEKWYGSDSVKRDEKHHWYWQKGATVVQDIERSK